MKRVIDRLEESMERISKGKSSYKQEGVKFIPARWVNCSDWCMLRIWTATKSIQNEICQDCGSKLEYYNGG